jgi:hypothetical protein
MSLIEQAAKRLEQLRKAGVEIPAPIAEPSLCRQPTCAPSRAQPVESRPQSPA